MVISATCPKCGAEFTKPEKMLENRFFCIMSYKCGNCGNKIKVINESNLTCLHVAYFYHSNSSAICFKQYPRLLFLIHACFFVCRCYWWLQYLIVGRLVLAKGTEGDMNLFLVLALC